MIDVFLYSKFRLWYHSRHTSLLEQLILKTICDEVRCSGVEEVLTAKIYDSVIPKAVYEGICKTWRICTCIIHKIGMSFLNHL